MKEMLDSKKTLEPTKNENQFPASCLVLFARIIANTEGTTDNQLKFIK